MKRLAIALLVLLTAIGTTMAATPATKGFTYTLGPLPTVTDTIPVKPIMPTLPTKTIIPLPPIVKPTFTIKPPVPTEPTRPVMPPFPIKPIKPHPPTRTITIAPPITIIEPPEHTINGTTTIPIEPIPHIKKTFTVHPVKNIRKP